MSDTPKTEKALNPTVVRLGFVSLFADIASEMLYPITPIFLTQFLGASMSSVGLIEGLAEGTASLLKIYSGRWSDRLQKRKFFIWSGYLLSALAKPLMGFAGSWSTVLGARIMDRFGKGIRTAPRDALIADSISDKHRGAAFGWHRAMDSIGAAIGPLLALIFLAHSEDLRALYYWAIIPGLISVLFALSVREVRPASTSQVRTSFSFKDLSLKFKSYLGAWALFSMGNSSDVFLLLKAQQSGISLAKTVLLYAFYNLLYALASPYLGQLSDRLGRKIILLSGLGVFAGVYLLFGFAQVEWQFWLLFGIYGIYMAATDGVGKAFAVDLIHPSIKATGLGALGTVTGLTTIVASSMAGFLWDHFGSQSTFIYGAVCSLLAAGLIFFIRENDVQIASKT